MKSIGLVTTARSEWGVQRTIAAAIQAHPKLKLHIIATGMHLSPRFGRTVNDITRDGFHVAHCLDSLAPGDGPDSIGFSIGEGTKLFAQLFNKWQPDILTLLGDRFDMLPAALAAVPFAIPTAHIHGGEVTSGAIDDCFRHAITKMAHIHFAATEPYAARIHQLGEPKENIHVVGAPAIDDFAALQPITDDELIAKSGFKPGEVNLLVVYHPETLAFENVRSDCRELLDALEKLQANITFIRPNADTGNTAIHEKIDGFCNRQDDARAVTSMSRTDYLQALRHSSALIGNSSSGIIEAPSFKIPAVNIGNRQAGRVRAANVIDCAKSSSAIASAIAKALSPEFRESLLDIKNPYGNGGTGARIADILAHTTIDRAIVCKRFVDLPQP